MAALSEEPYTGRYLTQNKREDCIEQGDAASLYGLVFPEITAVRLFSSHLFHPQMMRKCQSDILRFPGASFAEPAEMSVRGSLPVTRFAQGQGFNDVRGSKQHTVQKNLLNLLVRHRTGAKRPILHPPHSHKACRDALLLPIPK